jgi:hypothetical protein
MQLTVVAVGEMTQTLPSSTAHSYLWELFILSQEEVKREWLSLDSNPWPCHFLIVWCWANYLTSLNSREENSSDGHIHTQHLMCSWHTVHTSADTVTAVRIVYTSALWAQ